MIQVKKCSAVLSALLLSACSVVPEQVAKPAPVQDIQEVQVEPELVPDEVVHSDNAQPIATDFGLIFIDRDMTFTGTLPCQKCPGVVYHVNLYQDGKFEARREFIDRNLVELIEGSWQLDDRTLHFTTQRQRMPSFQFASNQHLTMLDVAGKPMVSADNMTLTRQPNVIKIDSRLPLLGMYQLKDNEASFTDCQTGESHQIAMTQHHLPMMRSYQATPGLNGKSVVATMTARKSPDNNQALFVDKFDQFWPGATCPNQVSPGTVQGVVWRLSSVSQIGVPQKLNIRMMFADNKLFGFSGCNNFNAAYEQKDNQLKVMPVVSTRKHCSDANFYEQQFTKQLQLADRVEVNQAKLQLFKDNAIIMEFAPATN